MFSIKQILTFAYESEYDSAYDLAEKQLFSNPKIYNANGDLKKRWYVYFSYRNPKTGKLKRLTPFYGNANTYKTKEERLQVLSVYRKTLLKLLKQGYNPYDDNTALFNKIKSNNKNSETSNPRQEHQYNAIIKKNHTIETEEQTEQMKISEAFELGLRLKKKQVGDRTYKDYNNKIKTFLKWIESTKPNIKSIDDLNKSVFQEFLNNILNKTSPRNRNNYRTDLSSIIQVLVDNDILQQNYLKSIKKLVAKPERHKTFSTEKEKQIFDHLNEKDKILLLFIKFYCYAFMRPIEVCRIRVKDLNIADKTVHFKAKNSTLKTKLLPDILLDELPDISNLNPEDLLFTPKSLGGKWNANEHSRRDYFSKRFKKVVKEHFGLGIDYGLYSFRHTFITKLYKVFSENKTPFEAKSGMMLITGHQTMNALELYLRDIDAELPQDFSHMLKDKL